jgi:primosomal protein N' (replication factor Y)
VLACPPCGWISPLHRCAANLVLHLADQRLRCHHCGFEAAFRAPARLRQRRPAALRPRHPAPRSHARERFPAGARAAHRPRFGEHAEEVAGAAGPTIHAGEADILVGTQMLAKGHDFPLLTLVGAVGADAALFAADFRAPERLFAQLMQVGGRSGRAALPGEVLIQTEYPDHPLYRALVDHDYVRFARKASWTSGASPASRPSASRPCCAPKRATWRRRWPSSPPRARRPSRWPIGVTLYDPVPMRLQRLMALERGQLLVESLSRPALQAFLAANGWSGSMR